ncbi:MAG: glycosyltransferase [Lachnospiraceae bacterium]|nr:glycosyltransferase [Lachnospiraceae bacterium]
MNYPKVSIIIPAYNLEGYIDKCLESVCAQTLADDMEIIVVDDGSTDNTPQTIDSWADKEKRIKVIHKKNEGVSAARNDGIKIAQGEYIFFFDGDDFMENYTCERLYKMAKEKSADSVVYGYYRYEDGKVKETCPPLFEKEIYQGEEIITKMIPQFVGLSYDNVNEWLQGKKDALYVENPALWRIMVSRKVIVDNDLKFDTRLKVGEDTVFISEYLSCAKKVLVDFNSYYYLVTRQTSTIFVYERKSMQKLQGKINLLDGRLDLTDRIKKRTGFDISDTWAGTVVMSAVEAGFLMSAQNGEHSLSKRYRAYKNYVTDERVKKIVNGFELGKAGGIKKIPFLLLKHKCYMVLFTAIMALGLVHYEFNRA